jgi:hypothetical protein
MQGDVLGMQCLGWLTAHAAQVLVVCLGHFAICAPRGVGRGNWCEGRV